jgi:lysozyme
MKLSPAGARALKDREGPNGQPALVGYADDNGTPTFGYGTIEGAVVGKVYTEEECDAAFDQASVWVGECIDKNVTVSLTQGQYDALFSFVYNIGSGAFEKSTLLKKLNKGDYASVPAEMLKWTISGGVKDPGLVNRRNSEGGQWVQGAYVRGSKIDIEAPPPIWRHPAVVKIGASVTSGAIAIGSHVNGDSVQKAVDVANNAAQHWHQFGIVAGMLSALLVVWVIFDVKKS